MIVTITAASREQEPIIQNLVQLYTHDFSEFWAGTTRGGLSPDGRFEAYLLDEYWSNPAWLAFLVWCDDELAGFALINDKAHSNEPVDHNMAEFFILRKYRGQGVGRQVAETIFSQSPGLWEVAVARKNINALAFWWRVINSSRNATGVYETDVSNGQWNGPIIRFKWSV